MWQRAATLVCGLAALAWRPSVGTLAVALLLPVLVTLARQFAARGAVELAYRARTDAWGPASAGPT